MAKELVTVAKSKNDRAVVPAGEVVIRKWIAWFRQYAVVTDGQALVIALFAINTWVFDRFETTPFLEIFAKTKRSGKTTVLKLLSKVCRGPKLFAIVRVLTLLRYAMENESKVTFCVDEAEQFGASTLGELRSSLASGYSKGGFHMSQRGGKCEEFSTFLPWAFACIGNVHDVLRDRCIEIEMGRGVPALLLDEENERANAEATALLNELMAAFRAAGSVVHVPMDGAKRAMLESVTGVPVVSPADTGSIPVVPAKWLEARERQLWNPLVSVAAYLGVSDDFMLELQAASVDLSMDKQRPPVKYHSQQAESDADGKDASERVLRDLRAAIVPGETFIVSGEAVRRLRAMPTAPWRKWQGDGINEMTLATLLRRFGIKSEQKRLPMKKGIGGERVEVFYVAAIEAYKL